MTENNDIKIVEQPKPKKVYATFKQRYDSDPEYRIKHLEYMKTEAQCECGVTVKRCHMGRHKNTKKHRDAMGITKATELRAAMDKFMESFLKDNCIKLPDIKKA